MPLAGISNFRSLTLALTFALAGAAASADELFSQQPHDWLKKMNQSVENLNYQGTLVYMRPGKAETFMVFHRVADNGVSERVVEMDGDGAEIVRTAEEVMCIFPRQRKVVVEQRGEKSAEKNPLRASLPSYTAAVDEQYELSIDSRERVVGRAAVVIAISPRDDFRYGYRIWLDETTAMPLRTQLLGQAGDMPIEELFFTSIAIDEAIPAQLIEPTLDTAGYVWVRHGEAVQAKDLAAGEVQWRVTNLPAGFMPTIASLEFMADAVAPRTHLVYSDGLASISVFVDPGVPAQEQVEGVATVGAANAYSVMVDGHLVTAMGEVPARTVQQVATSMRAED